MCVLVYFSLGLSLRDFWYFLDLINCSLSHVGKVSSIISSKNFSVPFFFFFFLWSPYNSNNSAFNIAPMVSEAILNSFHSFFLYSPLQQLFSPFELPPHLSILLPQLFCYWFLLEYFFISLIMLFISVCLFFIYFMSLVTVLTVLFLSFFPFYL